MSDNIPCNNCGSDVRFSPCCGRSQAHAETIATLTRDLAAAREELAKARTKIAELDEQLNGFALTSRVRDLNDQLAAANATVEKCKAAGFIDEKGEVYDFPIAGTTADGVKVRVGHPVFAARGSRIEVGYATARGEVEGVNFWAYSVALYYSTRTAAEAAREKSAISPDDNN